MMTLIGFGNRGSARAFDALCTTARFAAFGGDVFFRAVRFAAVAFFGVGFDAEARVFDAEARVEGAAFAGADVGDGATRAGAGGSTGTVVVGGVAGAVTAAPAGTAVVVETCVVPFVAPNRPAMNGFPMHS